jgi:hypothetical protein
VRDFLEPEDRKALEAFREKLALRASRVRQEQVVLVDPEVFGKYPEDVQRTTPPQSG